MNIYGLDTRCFILVCALIASLSSSAVATPPTVDISPTGTQTIAVGQTITYSSTGADVDGNLQVHNFHSQDPSGAWNWSGSPTGLSFNTSTDVWYGGVYTSSRSIIVTPSIAGTYHVQWSASDGTTWTDSTIYSLVVTASSAPTITTQPQNATVNTTFDVMFSVSATGGTLSYQWRKGGTNITGATSATLSLTNVATSAAGSYDVVVSNGLVTTSSSATLTVNDPNADADAGGIPDMTETALGTSASTTTVDSSNVQQQNIHRPPN